MSVVDAKLTSRLIIRNLPKYCNEVKLREFVESSVGTQVTDVKIPKNADGASRRIGFVGVKTIEEAKQAIEKLDRVFLDASRISVSPAYPPGSREIPRAWSRHVEGSSAYERTKDKISSSKLEKEEKINKSSALNKNVETLSAKAKENRQFASGIDNAEELPNSENKRKPEDIGSNNKLQRNKRLRTSEEQKNYSMSCSVDEGHASNDLRVNLNEHSSGQENSNAHLSKETDEENPLDWLKKKSENTANIGNEACSIFSHHGSDEDVVCKSEDQNKDISSRSNLSQAMENEDYIADTGRLLLINLPYCLGEDELKTHLTSFGEISEVHICRDQDRIKSTGRAFVQFAFPEHAVRAAAALEMSLLQGRLIRVQGARPLPPPEDLLQKVAGPQKKATSSYKRKLEEKLKQEAGNTKTWNLLYVSANAAVDAAATDLGLDKKDILGLNEHNELEAGESMAARVALGETHIIRQTKEWLKKEGINIAAFERQGASLLKSIIPDTTKQRSTDTIIVKHLPSTTTDADIYRLFSKSGPLVRYCLSPSKTVAVVQFMESYHAKVSFQRLAYTKFRNVPIFLEWAPTDVFINSKPLTTILEPHTVSIDPPTPDMAVSDTPQSETQAIIDMLEKEDSPVHTSLFVKNLNFSTTDDTLAEVFSHAPGFLKASVMKKVKNVQKEDVSESVTLSMGYGFIEFETLHYATEALKRFQAKVIDGHAVALKISQRVKSQQTEATESITATPSIDLSAVTNKLTVRNLAFQATKKDLRRLFGAFGNVIAVRIPKKADGTSRGYGFLEFLSRAEALTCLEALQHTHLYGRKMIIEPAEITDNSIETVRAKQAEKLSKEKTTESKARKIRATIDGENATRFKDAF